MVMGLSLADQRVLGRVHSAEQRLALGAASGSEDGRAAAGCLVGDLDVLLMLEPRAALSPIAVLVEGIVDRGYFMV
jgi:ABC-type thiamine transport system ATPase subunit